MTPARVRHRVNRLSAQATASPPSASERKEFRTWVLHFLDATASQIRAEELVNTITGWHESCSGTAVFAASHCRVVVGDPSTTFTHCLLYEYTDEPESGLKTNLPRSLELGLSQLQQDAAASPFATTSTGASDVVPVALSCPQLLLTIDPGWFHLDRAAPEPTATITNWSAEPAEVLNAEIPSGLVGDRTPGNQVGKSAATLEQLRAFLSDVELGEQKPGRGSLWHVNLLRFEDDAEKRSLYQQYAKAQGGRKGVLSQFGARSTLAAKVWGTWERARSGESFKRRAPERSFDQVIIAEYPSRDAFLAMGASEQYRAVSKLRHDALAETFIISMPKPDVLRSERISRADEKI
ncbi:unnamed protein product [Amoebophrya sp. A120]|nr:unnamed protein product [Amoebophrya sp. A120]CAD7975767.1 unnamed protein product [Amoebophrya sp. A120]|eukprot:GSA120T00026231001.1